METINNSFDSQITEAIRRYETDARPVDGWSTNNAWENYCKSYRRTAIRKFPSKWAIAASIALTLCVGIGVYVATGSGLFTSYITIQTGEGEKTRVNFPDGSQVWLNDNTILRYPEHFNRHKKVYLEGEAYFNLSGKQNKPFTIVAKNTLSTVTQSAFNIRARKNDNKVEVTITEGSVDISEQHGLLNFSSLPVITPTEGQKATIIGQRRLASLEDNKDWNYLAWKTGNIVFENTPLTDAATTIENSFGVFIRIESNTLGYLPITYLSRHENADDVLTGIAAKYGLTVTKTAENQYIIKLTEKPAYQPPKTNI